MDPAELCAQLFEHFLAPATEYAGTPSSELAIPVMKGMAALAAAVAMIPATGSIRCPLGAFVVTAVGTIALLVRAAQIEQEPAVRGRRMHPRVSFRRWAVSLPAAYWRDMPAKDRTDGATF